MARRWFSRKGLTCESEEFDITVHDLTKGRLNTHRILTDLDILSPVFWEFRMTSPGPSQTLTNALTTLNFAPISNPNSDTGVTKTNAQTFHLTKKGMYQFQVALVMNAASQAAVQFLFDGSPIDTQQSCLPTVIGTISLQHTFFFPYFVATDGPHDVTFKGAAEELPTPDASIDTVLNEISIDYWNVLGPAYVAP